MSADPPIVLLQLLGDDFDRQVDLVRLNEDVQVSPDTIRILEAVDERVIDLVGAQRLCDELSQPSLLALEHVGGDHLDAVPYLEYASDNRSAIFGQLRCSWTAICDRSPAARKAESLRFAISRKPAPMESGSGRTTRPAL